MIQEISSQKNEYLPLQNGEILLIIEKYTENHHFF